MGINAAPPLRDSSDSSLDTFTVSFIKVKPIHLKNGLKLVLGYSMINSNQYSNQYTVNAVFSPDG